MQMQVLADAAQVFAVLTEAEKATIQVLPFLGLGVVIVGLAILAIVLTQFKRLGGGDGHGKPARKVAPDTTPVTVSQPSIDVEEGELAAVAAAIGLYLEESAEVVNLTEVERQFNQSPWTAFGIQMQQYRFQRWQSTKG